MQRSAASYAHYFTVGCRCWWCFNANDFVFAAQLGQWNSGIGSNPRIVAFVNFTEWHRIYASQGMQSGATAEETYFTKPNQLLFVPRGRVRSRNDITA